MTYYAGLNLSMETRQVCIVDETGGKIASMKVESKPIRMTQPAWPNWPEPGSTRRCTSN